MDIPISCVIGFVCGGLMGSVLYARFSPTRFLCRSLQNGVLSLENKVTDLTAELKEAWEERASLQALLSTQKQQQELSSKMLYQEMENLSKQILKENTAHFTEISQEKLSGLLGPLQEKVDRFQCAALEMAKTGTAERLTLKAKIEGMMESSQALAQETHLLTRALKGDVKKQGAWGELVLRKVLEASGLRLNEEYIVQGEGLSLANEEGRRLQPDVIVQLPDNKKVIIDAKMPYTYYEEYFHAGTAEAKEKSLSRLVSCIKEHIKELSEKNYFSAGAMDTPHFVLLFIPIEAIFSVALQAEPSLFEEAWKKSIIVTSPTNLLAVLRTIESLWKGERQHRHTQRIAEEGAALYDKFVDFVKDLDGIGKSLEGARESYEKAKQKLSLGRGNLIKKTEDLKCLGLKTKKQLSSSCIEGASAEVEQ